MPRRHRDHTESQARPGFRLTHQGNDIGVVEYVEDADYRGIGTVHVRGGISGCLEYVIPTSAVLAVDLTERSAEIDQDVTFEPEVVARNGRVRLIARSPSLDAQARLRPRQRLTPACLGYRVYADDGYLGDVEAVLCREQDDVDYLTVGVRRRFRHRRAVIEIARVVSSDDIHAVVAVAGTCRELLLLPHAFPQENWTSRTHRRID